MNKFTCVIVILVALLQGCVEYHPYDMHISGSKQVNAINITRIEEACHRRQQIRFAVVSDSQRWYDELEDAVEDICERDDIDFVIHAGDLTDWGLRSEYEMQRDILNCLDVPYVCLIGNHDCLGTGKRLYEEILGPMDFAFTAGDVRFICLNTNALEFGEQEPVPNLGFMTYEQHAFPVQARRTVVAMHAYPLCDQFRNDEEFQQRLRLFPNLQFCVHGHGHRYREEDIFGDGVIYYECANVESEEYLVFTINDKGYECERVFY